MEVAPAGQAQQDKQEWDVPITAELKAWVQEYLEKKLWTEHGGRLTQEASMSMGKRDRNLERRVEKLAIRAADVHWL